MRAGARSLALAMAVVCHSCFALAIASMAIGLGTGLESGRGHVAEPWAPWANVLLLVQFPLVHSFLLSRRGRPVLERVMPFGHGRTLAVTTYACVASLQVLGTFAAWTPSHVVWHRPDGWLGGVQWLAFAGAWSFLQKAILDAGLAVQTGAAGWWALWRGQSVRYPDLPTRGLFARCRQPIYLGFALVLWTAPVWSLDWLALASAWSAYCVIGPRFKEARFARLFGSRFAAYRASVPYLLPRLRR